MKHENVQTIHLSKIYNILYIALRFFEILRINHINENINGTNDSLRVITMIV